MEIKKINENLWYGYLPSTFHDGIKDAFGKTKGEVLDKLEIYYPTHWFWKLAETAIKLNS